MMFVERLISLLAPHTCVGCGAEGSLLCVWGAGEAILPVPSRCYRCSKLTIDAAVCPSCRKQTVLKHVWVANEYDGLPKKLVYALKFERAKAATQPMAQIMHQRLPYLPPDTIITHIPTATSRRRHRGYDQAELLARELARLRELRHVPLLARLGHTRQVGASRTQRITQLQDSYRPLKGFMVAGASILLIDDILTTGATVDAAARTLRQAGAKRVDAAIFAQKQ